VKSWTPTSKRPSMRWSRRWALRSRFRKAAERAVLNCISSLRKKCTDSMKGWSRRGF